MKWLYITFGILGGLVPAVYLYARTYANAENKVGAFDLGLFFLGVGLGFMAMPLGVGAGLLVAALVHLGWTRLHRRRRPSVGLSAQGERWRGARHSWLTQGLTRRPGAKLDDASEGGPR